MIGRRVPLIVVASATPGTAERVAGRLIGEGAVAYATHSVEGCLRVATSVAPDVVLLDPMLPRAARSRLVGLLKAHPTSAHALVRPLTEAVEQAEVERTAHLVAA